MNQADSTYYKRCCDLIEKKINWEDSSHWTHNHFKKLSAQIEKETGTKLSHNTLKRFWGRLNYKGKQSPYTKDTLAIFIGYEN
ncbi:MAG: hypothetical protein ACOC3T_04895 [Bacteroidota bacterium]